jgi:ketosteroid isomerase-like protein
LSSASRCWLLFGAIAIWVVTIGSGIVIGGRVGREIDKASRGRRRPGERAPAEPAERRGEPCENVLFIALVALMALRRPRASADRRILAAPERAQGRPSMAGDLEKRVSEFFRLLDAKDFDGMLRTATDDVQTVDELSRKWLRGRVALQDYFREFGPQLSDIQSTLKDMRETVWGDAGIVTCWLEQDYTYQSKRQHVSAPTTAVLRRTGSEWRLALFHSVPLA